MVLQCKKGKHFATGEVFPLDIGPEYGARQNKMLRRFYIPIPGHSTPHPNSNARKPSRYLLHGVVSVLKLYFRGKSHMHLLGHLP